MNKTTKTILIIVSTLLLLCVWAGAVTIATGLWSFNRFTTWAEVNTSEDLQGAVRIGSEIAEFDVPSGFESPFGIHFGEVIPVRYTSQNKLSYLLLAQFPEETSINMEGILKILEDVRTTPTASGTAPRRRSLNRSLSLFVGAQPPSTSMRGQLQRGLSIVLPPRPSKVAAVPLL